MKKIARSAGLALILSLFAAAAYAQSGVTADPTSLDFGNQPEDSVSAAQTVTLTNSLPGDGIISSIGISGQNQAEFLVTRDLCSGQVLADGESCEIDVVFAPTSEFSAGVAGASASLDIFFQVGETLGVGLTGNVLSPHIVSNTSSLNMGDEVAGKLSDSQTVIITNQGGADLVLHDNKFIGAAPVDFGLTADFCSFQTLAPGDNCQMQIAMRPTEIGQRNAQFLLESNDPETPFLIIDLTGKGTGSGGCGLSGPSGAFGFSLALALGLSLAGLGLLRLRSGK